MDSHQAQQVDQVGEIALAGLAEAAGVSIAFDVPALRHGIACALCYAA